MAQNLAIEDNKNKLFVKDRHGIVTRAILADIRRQKVVLKCPEREDKFTVTIKEFNKYYQLSTA